MDKITRINMIFSIVLQIVTIISGFIIPRQILLAFGSEVNGLVNSITQFLNYISLIEGGLGSVIMTALYQPLNQKKFEQVSSIIVTSNNFFRKIAKIFIGYLLLVAVFYPLIVKTSFSYGFIFSLTMILGIGLFIQYYFAIPFSEKIIAQQYSRKGHGIIPVTFSRVIIKFYPTQQSRTIYSRMLWPDIPFSSVRKFPFEYYRTLHRRFSSNTRVLFCSSLSVFLI